MKLRYVIFSCLQGQATDIQIQAEEILRLKDRLNKIYSKHTGKPLEVIGKEALRGRKLGYKTRLIFFI